MSVYRKWSGVLGVAVAIIISLGLGKSVGASQSPVTRLSISPLRTTRSIAPGTQQSGTLTLANSSAVPMTVHLDAEKFSVTNDRYDYSFNPDDGIVKWVSFSQNDFTIAPGKNQKVIYTIGVPINGDPGDKYFSLFASTDTLSDNGQIKSQQRVASLVYLTVTGNASRIGNLVSLKSPWLITGRSAWSMNIRNSGTVYFRSMYSVTVRNLFGGKAGSYMADAMVLARSVRTVTGTLPEPQWPGLYKAVYTASLGDKPTISQTKLFLYIPWWSVGALIVLVAMILGTIAYVRSLKKTS